MEIKRIWTLRFSDNQYITRRKSFTDYWDSGHEFGDHVKISCRDLEGIWVLKSLQGIWSVARFTCTNEIWHINYNISSTLAATKLSPGTNDDNMLNYRSAKNYGFLLNSTFFRNLFFTKMCIIRAVTRNIHTQQIIILLTFHVLTIIDLSRTSILINQNYS